MPRIPLTGGAYQSRAIIASSQRCINLYPEVNEDEQAPAPATHFPTPGLTRRGTPLTPGVSRCLFRSSNNQLYHVVGGSVYYIDATFTYQLLGVIPNATTPVSMADNGRCILIVNGSISGWAIDLSNNAFGPVTDPVFEGGSHVSEVDGFFVLNRWPVRQGWYISLNNIEFKHLALGVMQPFPNPNNLYAFDPLDYQLKIGSPDPIAAITVMHKNIWILGTLTGESWYNSGAADFVFQILPGVFNENGCTAPYSLAAEDLAIYWLTQSRRGKRTVMKWDAAFQAKVISKPGIEAIFARMPAVHDAIGGTFQILGHSYYILTFPTANRTFACELKTEQWHELAWTGPAGFERHRGQCWCFAYDMVLTGDRATGDLYEMDPFNLTDAGNPITRLRTIPHVINDGKRVRIDRVIADTQGGTLGGAVPGPYSRSIQDIVGELALPAPTLLLEAGNLPSWPGSGQKWFDESGGGYDFFLGDDAAVVPGGDPSFVGTPGGLSLSEYFLSGGSGTDHFTYDAPNEAWMNNIHKDGAKFTILTQWYHATSAPNGVMLGGDLGASSGTGLGWLFGTDPTGAILTFAIFNFSPTPVYAINLAPAFAPPVGSWNVSAVSISEGTSAFIFNNGGVTVAGNPNYTAPSAAPATFPMQIGARGNAFAAMPANTRMGFMAIWEGVALTQAQVQAFYAAVTENNQLPSPLFSTPLISLRVSYDRGGSFSDALQASMGNEGEYGELPWWPNLGIGRDIVFELSWSAPIDTALNGIFLEATPVGS